MIGKTDRSLGFTDLACKDEDRLWLNYRWIQGRPESGNSLPKAVYSIWIGNEPPLRIGTIFLTMTKEPTKRDYALSRRLLGLDGKPCPNARDLDKGAIKRLRELAEKSSKN